MMPDEIKKASEIAKNTSEAAKNFHEIIERIFQPRGLDLAILNGHSKLIESYMKREDIDELTKLAFLSNYKKLIKEFRNCTKVVALAAEQISENARPQDVEEDWFTFFFDKVRLVSDEKMQEVWSKILRNEVDIPGRYRRSLLHTLSIISPAQAQVFQRIVTFSMYDYKKEEIAHPFLFVATNVKTYERAGIHATELVELERLGLIQCDFKDEFVFENKKVLRYGNKVIEIYGNPQNNNKINAGNVSFTYDGLMLLDIVKETEVSYRPDILDFVITKLQQRNCRVLINEKEVR